jgi:fatty-acid desaturase
MTQLQALERKPPANDQTNWVTAFFMAAFHIGAVAALFFFTWKALFVAIFLWWVPFLLWGIFLRTVVGLHATWLVNSATHIWGSRRFATRDDSTNNWFVALLTFGEGWHNNHHAHPTSARHGLKWYEIDMNWYGIWTLKIFGLATQIKRERRPVATRSFAASDLIT